MEMLYLPAHILNFQHNLKIQILWKTPFLYNLHALFGGNKKLKGYFLKLLRFLPPTLIRCVEIIGLLHCFIHLFNHQMKVVEVKLAKYVERQ